MAETLFHILPRTPDGALSAFAQEQLEKANINVSFERAVPASFADRVELVLKAFRQALPKSVILPADSPFLILGTQPEESAEEVHPMQCLCNCGHSGGCGGGGSML